MTKRIKEKGRPLTGIGLPVNGLDATGLPSRILQKAAKANTGIPERVF